MHKLKYLIFLAAVGLIAFPFVVKPQPTIVESKTIEVSPTPTPTTIPTPKPQIIYVQPQIVLPTQAPQPTQQPNVTNITYVNPTNTPTPTPTPQVKTANIIVDLSTKTCEITGQNAWECIKSAFGIENLKYDDYGGDLGVFITGFNGHNAGENEFWEFSVNGASSSVGISSYIPVENDVLSFNLKTF